MSAKVEKRRTCTVIHNYEMGDSPYIEKMFSIWDKLYHRYRIFGIYYDEKNKDLYLPSGMDDYFIYRNFYGDIFEKNIPDQYEEVDKILLKYKPRDEIQIESIKFCLGLDQYYKNRDKAQLSLNLATGKGKTYVAITIFAYYHIKSAMITSTIDWLYQWKEKILEYTNLTDKEVYIISGKASIIKLFNGIHDHNNIKFYLVSHDTIKAYANNNGWESVSELFKKLKIGIKIFDESHLYLDNTIMIDNFTNTWKTYYLTATPMKSDTNEDKIYQRLYEKVPKISMFDQDNDPHTEYLAIHFNSHPNPLQISDCQNVYGFDRIKYENYLVSRPNYFKLLRILMEIISNKVSPEGKCLIYIGTNYAINITYYWLSYYFRNLPVGIFTSLVPKDQKRFQLNNKIILTTTKSAGAALDIPGLEMTIILNEPFKSKQLAIQTLGRTRAKDTMYIEVIDTGFKSIKYYYKSKLPVMNKYATKCSEIILSDNDLDQKVMELDRRDLELIKMANSNKNLKTVVKFKNQ